MGRPPKGAEAKRHVITMRVTDEGRQKIQDAAEASGRSISQEIEFRLEQSFNRDDLAGSPSNSAFLHFAAAYIGEVEALTGKRWTEDPVTWAAVRDGVLKAVNRREPRQDEGDTSDPKVPLRNYLGRLSEADLTPAVKNWLGGLLENQAKGS